MSVQVGETAPEFELPSHRGETVRLSSFAGQKNVVIAFHPLAFTPVCATQMQSYEQDKSWFDAHQTHLLGLSVDADVLGRPRSSGPRRSAGSILTS